MISLGKPQVAMEKGALVIFAWGTINRGLSIISLCVSEQSIFLVMNAIKSVLEIHTICKCYLPYCQDSLNTYSDPLLSWLQFLLVETWLLDRWSRSMLVTGEVLRLMPERQCSQCMALGTTVAQLHFVAFAAISVSLVGANVRCLGA